MERLIIKCDKLDTIYSYLIEYPEEVNHRNIEIFSRRWTKNEEDEIKQFFNKLGASETVFNYQQEKIYVNYNKDGKDDLLNFSNRIDIKRGFVNVGNIKFNIRPKYEYHSSVKLLGEKNINIIKNKTTLKLLKEDIKYNFYIPDSNGYNDFYIYFSNESDMFNIVNKYLEKENIIIKYPKLSNMVFDHEIKKTDVEKIKDFKLFFENHIKKIDISKDTKEEYKNYIETYKVLNKIGYNIEKLIIITEYNNKFKDVNNT